MQTIRHPNLLIFYGAGIDKDSRAFLVTELMAGGSLRKMLLDRSKDISWSMRLVFATDAAKGMRYLHEKKTLHRDLKSGVYLMAWQLPLLCTESLQWLLRCAVHYAVGE